MKACDYLIIGAGIAGASVAYELAPHGRVLVLEGESAPGYHTTGRSAAQFLETYGNATIRSLTRASRPFLESPPENFTAHPLLHPRPAIYIAREDQLDALARLENNVYQSTDGIERLPGHEVVAMVPVLRADYVAAGIAELRSTDIDVHALHQGYLQGLRQRGGEVIVNASVGVLERKGGMWTATTRAGSFSAPIIVAAAGAWNETIGALAGTRPIGLQPKRRTVITFDGVEGLKCKDWPLIADIGETFYFKPESGRLLASPADETPMPPCDVQPDELDIAITVDRIETATTLKVRRITHKWAGLRSFVADKSLVIGFADDVDGFFWLAGQGGFGIQTAPAAARVAAGLIVTGAMPKDVAELQVQAEDLSPSRLPRVRNNSDH